MTNLEDRQQPKHFPSQWAMENLLQFYLYYFPLSGWGRGFDKEDIDTGYKLGIYYV